MTAAKKAASDIPTDKLIRLYDRMVAIRLFEERVNDLYTRALMPGLAHLYIGEEAIAVGVCEALNRKDYITSTHRGHGHCLAKGATPDLMFAELLGKEAGYCKGKGGSMHIADPATGNLGANAIVGGSAGIATGAAFASKYLKTGQVAVCFFGEGALGQGLLYEELNLAQLWQLPVIFVCENNGYNEYTHFSESTAGDVAKRAEAFGMANETADGQNVREVFAVASKYIERARSGGGPAFLQFKTYRYHGHHVGDIARAYYRPKAEEQEWVTERDPITLHGTWLMENGVATRAELDAIQEKLVVEMDAAVDFAVDASYPDPSKVTEDVYA
ncbi:MAG TPA: thiamine pyrophosphate-dependent dehydrogenase E1 component subunit alpha [Vicinamibacterales bacterium]|jgi:pyruvate dehydrogenase E1 component alpha subunit|nr:thiamine pyrophosphate-dependent dehydrogenase E1 component subunit alpha [Vicinamibacterales bacterium]